MIDDGKFGVLKEEKMLTFEPTSEMIAEWKRIFEIYHCEMKPNRKTGYEVDKYFKENYLYQIFDNARFQEIVALNITENECYSNKLPKGVLPDIQSYKTANVLVGIDLCSGEFHVESENIEEVMSIHDDLFAFRGLDEEDLKNYFLVAEYIKLTKTDFQV